MKEWNDCMKWLKLGMEEFNNFKKNVKHYKLRFIKQKN